MNWSTTTKPWAICKASGKAKANSKSLFRKSLLALYPSQPETFPPQTIKCYVVDAMRVVRKIAVSDLEENTYACWAKRFTNYLSSLPGNEVHVVFGNYEIIEEVSISKGRSNICQERNITSLNQSLPKLREWEPFLSNDNNKKRLLLCDYILLPHSIKKNVYVTKGDKCFQKTEHDVIEIQTLKSNHKEADRRIIHHAHFASDQHNSVCIVADDSDILVLLLYIS